MCEDVTGGSELSAGGTFFSRNTLALPVGPSCQGETFFRKIRWPVRWDPVVRWRNNYFARNKEALSCGRLDPAVSLSTYSTLPMKVGR